MWRQRARCFRLPGTLTGRDQGRPADVMPYRPAGLFLPRRAADPDK
jgi:hypothetical protein